MSGDGHDDHARGGDDGDHARGGGDGDHAARIPIIPGGWVPGDLVNDNIVIL